VRAFPVTLRIAILLMFVEAAALAVVAVLVGYVVVTEPADTAGAVLTAAALPAVYAALLALLGWQLGRRRRWARGPAVVLELLLALLGYSATGSGGWWLGVAAMVAGLTCTGLLVAPASRDALNIQSGGDPLR
jgi:hypothetical protein